MDSANINSFEFVYKHSKTTNTQTLVESSGSDAEKLWDLRLVPSSDGASSSFEFRLINSETVSLLISTNAVSMSTQFSSVQDGQLWNVMVQRMTASAVGVGEGTNEYHLYTSLQEGSKISKLNFVTMSISGGFATDPDQRFYSNKNKT